MFNDGMKQTMDQILDHRERRSDKQLELLSHSKTELLVVITLNIPGPIKRNDWLNEVFHICTRDVKKRIESNWPISHDEEINEASGMDYFIVVSAPIKEIKQQMIELEETHSFGRLMDIDVIRFEDGAVVPIGRDMFDYSERKCFVCDQPAKQCARNRTHSLEELESNILRRYQEAKRSQG